MWCAVLQGIIFQPKLLKYVTSQRSYGFLITKELIFGFQIFYLKDHFSASLIVIKTSEQKFTIQVYIVDHNNI